MKKFIIFMCLFGMLKAETYQEISQESAYKVNLNIGLCTTHIKVGTKDYDFYENNNIIGLEIEKNKELIGISTFTNSFGNESLSVYYGKIFDKNNKGFNFVLRSGVCYGYNETEYLPSKTVKNVHWVFNNPTVFYDKLSLIATCGVGYNFNENYGISLDLIGNAVVSGIKFSY